MRSNFGLQAQNACVSQYDHELGITASSDDESGPFNQRGSAKKCWNCSGNQNVSSIL